MKFYFLFSFVLFLIHTGSGHIFDVDFLNDFPVYEEENFHMKFITNGSYLPESLWVVLRIGDDFSPRQIIAFNPSFTLKFIEIGIKNKLSIINYTIDDRDDIRATVRFHRNAQHKSLEIFKLVINKNEDAHEKLKHLDNYPEMKLLLFPITLNLHWTFKMTQKVNHETVGGLLDGQKGIIACQALDGSPHAPVKLLGLENLYVFTHFYDKETNTDTAIIEGRLEDHNKPLFCKADDEIYFKPLKIFHHPSSLDLEPKVDHYIESNTTLKCVSVNGYPEVQADWKFQYGPTNASMHFEIDKTNKSMLHIKKSAPVGSNWQFFCSANNVIPGYDENGKSMNVNFTIKTRFISKMIIISIGAGIVISILMGIAVFVLARRSCRSVEFYHDGQNPQPINDRKRNLSRPEYPVDEV